jgi:hypothetical protein
VEKEGIDRMKNILKIIFVTFICSVVVIGGTYIASFFGLTDPSATIFHFFERFEISYSYNFNHFGEAFRLWSAAALFPMTGEQILVTPILWGGLIPLGLFGFVCFIMGYFYKLPNGISMSVLVFLWTIFIGVVSAALVPQFLPAVGLPPAEYEFVRGLADELIIFTLLAPPNMIGGTAVTIGIGLVATLIGGFFHKLPFFNSSEKTTKKKQKKKTTTSATAKKTAKSKK